MSVKLASPLFILRDEAGRDLFAVLEKLGALGFDGVEFLGFFGKSAAEIREKLDSLSMKAVGNHVGVYEFKSNPEKVVDDHIILGCGYLTIAWPDQSIKPGSGEFDAIVKDIGLLAGTCRANGITPLYHNHDYEFETVPSMVDIVMERCQDAGLRLEPDLGWMAFKGADPAEYLTKYSVRCPVIHLKDIYAEDISLIGKGMDLGTEKADPEKGFFEFRPVGYGMVNMPKLMPLCLRCKPEWLVLDHDMSYERDSFGDLELSIDYTKSLLDIM